MDITKEEKIKVMSDRIKDPSQLASLLVDLSEAVVEMNIRLDNKEDIYENHFWDI